MCVVALLYHSEGTVSDRACDNTCTTREEEEESEEVDDDYALQEMSFMELQYGFEAIAVQLHYRFGVRVHDRVSGAVVLFRDYFLCMVSLWELYVMHICIKCGVGLQY